MKFISTRGAEAEGVSSAYAIKTGLASDGGLYMPVSIPKIDLDFIKSTTSLSYPERAAKILALFLTDYTEEELLEDARAAYSAEKFIPSPAPITYLGDNKYMQRVDFIGTLPDKRKWTQTRNHEADSTFVRQ